jgi:hypothetical protein
MPARRNQSAASVTMSSSMITPCAKASVRSGGKLRDLVSHDGGALTQLMASRPQRAIKRRGLLEQGMGGCPNKPRRYRPNFFSIGDLSGLSAATLGNGSRWLIGRRPRLSQF